MQVGYDDDNVCALEMEDEKICRREENFVQVGPP